MAKYIKQEVPDMQKTGEQKVFYRLKVERNVDFQEFIQRLCSHHSGINRGAWFCGGLCEKVKSINSTGQKGFCSLETELWN